jgi:urease accessory protein
MTMGTEDALRLARLLHLASPLLPVGAYSYSQGLEAAIANGWVSDEASAGAWISDTLTHVVGRLEAPVLVRLWEAAHTGDQAAYARWNTWFIASRETRELREETVQMGHALAVLAPTLSPELQPLFRACPRLAYPSGFAAYAAAWSIPAASALVGYLWGWAENQVLAAMKIIPLGQTAGQRLLLPLRERCGEIARLAGTLSDDDLGTAGAGHALASCHHETQYMRLFRS